MPPPFTTGLSPVEQEILRTLLYFDIFHHPLSASEIVRFCPVPGLTEEAVHVHTASGRLSELVREESGHFSIRGSSRATLAARREMEERAMQLWPAARRMSRLIARFPYVRGVFVSGELAKGVAGPDSDIDYLIVTAEHRLWLCRTLLILFKKTFLLNRRKYFCINHLQTIGHLESAARSYYAAVEVATLRPMINPELYGAFVKANRWIEKFLPNLAGQQPTPAEGIKPSIVRRLAESLVPSAVADALDDWLRRRWEWLWERRYPQLSRQERSERFACTPTLSTAYGTDIANEIHVAWSSRLRGHGLLDADHEAL
jgi:hypothetical protein